MIHVALAAIGLTVLVGVLAVVAKQTALRGIGAVLLVAACLAVVFIGAPVLADSLIELPESFALWYLITLVATVACCVIAGWRLISDGRRSILGVGLLFGSLLFFLPLTLWLLKLLGDALGES